MAIDTVLNQIDEIAVQYYDGLITEVEALSKIVTTVMEALDNSQLSDNTEQDFSRFTGDKYSEG